MQFFRLSCFLLLSMASLKGACQQENAFWYFGKFAGLSFHSGTAQSLSNSQMNTSGACASISDEDGQLLFYTNGVNVWNGLHQPMVNGQGLFGNAVSTQTRIVPLPASDNLYYLFTVDRLGWEKGFRYSVIDMEASNGLGGVVEKNIPVFTPSTEKIAVALHCNRLDRWVITHEVNNNHFRAYQLTSSGLNSTPVISPTGTTHYNGQGATGYLKASPDGTRLAAMTRIFETFGRCEIFDFDPASGEVSNPVLIDSLDFEVYGVEFSPDGSKLYFASGILEQGVVYQVDLNAGSNEAVVASVTNISNGISINSQVSALQLAPDGNIYLAKRNATSLGAIQAPNEPGLLCQFEDDVVTLVEGRSRSGLPAKVYSREFDPSLEWELACAEMPSSFSLLNETLADSVRWDFGDPASGLDNFSEEWHPVHAFSEGGIFEVGVTVFHPCGPYTLSETMEVSGRPVVDLPEEILLCDGESVTIDFSHVEGDFAWRDGGNSAIHNISTPGFYSLTVTNNCGTRIRHGNAVSFELTGFDGVTVVCPGDSVLLTALTSVEADHYGWSNGSTGPSTWITTPGTYHLDLTYQNCVIRETVEIESGDECRESCELTFIPNAFTPNFDGINDVWQPLGCFPEGYSLLIYGRWGQQVFATTDPTAGWDGNFRGQPLQSGVYVWMISFLNEKGELEVESGDLLLVR